MRVHASPPGYGAAMTDHDQEAFREGLKRVAVALKETGLPFALTGGYAAWVHGAPEPAHDVDFLVAPEDAAAAAEKLAADGLDVRRPAEDWLFKVHTDGVVVDVIHRCSGTEPADALRRAVVEQVLSVRMPVLAPTDVVTEKLLALDEHYCDLAGVLPTMRALREQVDWGEVRRRSAGAPFSETVLFLLGRLGVVEAG
jgi:hypothetical protein